MVKRLTENVKNIFCLDLRALALFRIGVSFTVILDLCLRLRDFEGHYTDQGILPLEALFRHLWGPYHFSLYTLASGKELVFLIFSLNLLSAFFLLIGYRTRLFSIICWVFLLSLHNRNPLVLQGGDDLLRMLLFWGMFLPWGKRYSVMSERSNPAFFGLAGIALVLQILYVYFFSAMLKSSPEWNSEYSAIYYALSLDQMVYPFGKFIYAYPLFLKVSTAIVYYIELLAPLLVLIPYKNHVFRLIFIALIVLLHTGIALSLNVGLFPVIGLVSLLALIPGKVMDYFFENDMVRQENVAEKGVRMHPGSEIIAFVFLVYVTAYNIDTIVKKTFVAESKLLWPGILFKVAQQWSMFAPSVYKDDGWFVMQAEKEDGNIVDINREGLDVDFEKPVSAYRNVKNDRWRKYHENILFIHNSHFRPYYCVYLLNSWNKHKSDKVKGLDIVFVKEFSLPNYELAVPEQILLERCSCD